MNQRIVISNLQYFPSIASFSALLGASKIIFDNNLNYNRSSYFNKCKIAGANNVILLSVPLKKAKTNKQKISEVEIANYENWHLQHWRGIQSAYKKSPFFEMYELELEQIFLTENQKLLDLNLKIFGWLKTVFNLSTEIVFAKQFVAIENEFTDLRFALKPTQIPTWFKQEKYFQLFEHN